MMRFAMLLAILAAFIGCATTQPVTLRHPNTGAVVQCGPYKVNFFVGPVGGPVYQQERDCIADYQRQGYERAPR